MDIFNMDGLQGNLGMDDMAGKFGPGEIHIRAKKEVEVIEDIIVINAGRDNKASVPAGYEQVGGDLNEGAGGDYIYFAVKRGTNAENAINGLEVVSGRNDRVPAPAGYERDGMDLNRGAGGRYIYLCRRRGREGAIHDVKVVSSPRANPAPPEGYTMIGKDLNEGAGGKYIYLCYA